MAEPSLPELEALRDRLYARLATVGDFRRGSVSVNYRRCGKPNCACADQDHPGHGPRFRGPGQPGGGRPRPAAGRRGGGQGPGRDRPACRVRGDQHADRRGQRDDLRGEAAGRNRRAPGAGGRKRGLFTALAEEKSAELTRLTAEAARALGCENGLGAAEAVLREGLLSLGGSMLGRLLSADPGYRGPRVPCGNGHQAVLIDYRDKRLIPSSARSPCTVPGTPARNAGTASRRGMPSSASRARPCPRDLPR